ncbi:hypothetical protein [Rhizobium sp. WW_1]|jgi:hypothetical protein|uniref:hypothetical protein n=1 Tax=Rhizobium sp. WW_1 TaxID=1907375 RepID=UPI0006464439|nr:hypothetical protein [Rhizobium sp. WW_1]RKD61535.1 hypothetical protein BJ928_107136 [Rhizobium sp. WW_1]
MMAAFTFDTDPPIGGVARALLRRVFHSRPEPVQINELDLPAASACVRAGMLCFVGVPGGYVVTFKGEAYLDRLRRCE